MENLKQRLSDLFSTLQGDVFDLLSDAHDTGKSAGLLEVHQHIAAALGASPTLPLLVVAPPSQVPQQAVVLTPPPEQPKRGRGRPPKVAPTPEATPPEATPPEATPPKVAPTPEATPPKAPELAAVDPELPFYSVAAAARTVAVRALAQWSCLAPNEVLEFSQPPHTEDATERSLVLADIEAELSRGVEAGEYVVEQGLYSGRE